MRGRYGRYGRGWSRGPPPPPPPPALSVLLDARWQGHGIYLYVRP